MFLGTRRADAPLVTFGLWIVCLFFFLWLLTIWQVVQVLLSTRRADAPLVSHWKMRCSCLAFLLHILLVILHLLALLLDAGSCGTVRLVRGRCICLALATLALYSPSCLPSLSHQRTLKGIVLFVGVYTNIPILGLE